MSNRLSNLLVLVLLSLVVFGVYTIPDVNYGEILTQQKSLERRVDLLLRRVETLSLLTPAEEAKTRAAVDRATDLRDLLISLGDDLDVLSGRVAGLEIEAVSSSRTPDRIAPEDPPTRYTEPTALRSRARLIADTLAPTKLAESDFEAFLDEVIRSGLVAAVDADSDGHGLPESFLKPARILFSLFSNNMEVIRQEQLFHVQEEVAAANSAGEYLEIPMTNLPNVFSDHWEEGTRGLKYVEIDYDKDVKRVYAFDANERPDMIAYYSERRSNARDRLIGDIDRLANALGVRRND